MPGKHAAESSSSFYLSLGKAVGGALAAVAVMAALVIVLLSRGSAEEPSAGPTVSTSQPTATRTSPSPTPSPTATSTVLSASRVTVDVLNGTARAGLARRTGDEIEQAGYKLATVGNAPRTAKSTIFYRPGRRAEALALQQRFPDFTVLTQATASQRSILRVVLGADWPEG